LLREGKLAPPHWQAIPLNEAARAHALLEARGVKGRVLLVP
jgi:NADPH2:quinone reductase